MKLMGKRRYKRSRTIMLVLALLMMCLFAGCSEWKNYVHTDAGLKAEARKALREKYGEEFTVHWVYAASRATFVAGCSPERDSSIVFEATLWKNGDGVIRDEYVEGIVDSQIEAYLQEQLEEFWPGCYVYAGTFVEGSQPQNVQTVTMEEYTKAVEGAHSYLMIYIPEGSLHEETIADEYIFFSEEIADKIEKRELPKLTGRMYVVDEQLMKQIKDYWQENSDIYHQYDTLVSGKKYMIISFSDKVFNETNEEYTDWRKELMKNE